MAENHTTGRTPPKHHHMPHHHHHIHRHRVPSGGDEPEDEELDPRIQIELEKLNRASEEINRLELELDDARAAFRQVLSDSTQRLNGLAKKLGTCVDKARPYYDARMRLKEAHLESQKAALRFERACSMHEAAKEMVQLAEEGYKRREEDLDPTWQEMLNHATMKVNDAERERIESEDFHQRTTVNFKQREEEVQKLQKDLKRTITKSKPYFEMKAKFNQVMEDHKRSVSRLEEDVGSAKALYSQALRSLEAISDDIHRQRLERRQKLQLGVRGAGVGAEAPSPPPSWEKGINIEGSASSHQFDSDGDEDPLNASHTSHSSETLLDVHQLSMKRSKGIVRHEPAFRKKASLTETHIREGHYKTDPLEVAVFRTSTSDVRSTSSSPPKYSKEYHATSLIRNHPDRARNASYRAAVDASQEEPRPERGRGGFMGREVENIDHDVTPTPDNIHEFSSVMISSPGVELSHRGHELNASVSPERDPCHSPLSESPRTRDIELSQSSLNRAQEWVNKSPLPQQRRFVKSKSLIDASSSNLSISSPPSDTELSASLTSEAIKGMAKRDGSDPHHPMTPSQTAAGSPRGMTPPSSKTPPVGVSSEVSHGKPVNNAVKAALDSSHLSLSGSPHLTSSQNSVRSLSSTPPDQASPITGSPSSQRKSPKLQGLILRVDATGISSTAAPSAGQQSKPQTYTSAGTGHQQISPKVVISTQHPTLGVFTEMPAQQSPPPTSSTTTTAPSSSVPVSSAPSTSPSSIPPSAKPPSSLIAQHLNKMMNVSKVSQYNSKTAPSTLSTSYHLPSASSSQKSPHAHPKPQPSPTRNPLSPNHRHQLNSPTPSSPSADRYSLSGRSDSIASGSQRGAFLKPPSDSSDTESIASTGPMLDDDQVELINMDFTEQSIAPDNDYEENPIDPASISRGHWSRMSLPPRLSYLEGFLERARLYSVDKRNDANEDSEDRQSDDDVCDKCNDDDRSSVAASGDLEDKDDDFIDEMDKDDGDEMCGESQDKEVCAARVNEVVSNSCGEDNTDINVDVQLTLESDVEDAKSKENVKNSHQIVTDANEVSECPTTSHTSSSEEPVQGETNPDVDVEATVVISPDKGLKIVEGTTTVEESSKADSTEHFV